MDQNAVALLTIFTLLFISLLSTYLIHPFSKKVKRDLILSSPKFYLFDVGVANYLQKIKISHLKMLL